MSIRVASFFVLFLLSNGKAFAGDPADSLIAQLQEKNLILLNSQLLKLSGHDLRARLEPDRHRWPEIFNRIAEKAILQAESFSATGQAVVLSHFAEVMVREGNVIQGYSLAVKALKKTAGVEGLPQAYVFGKYADILNSLNFLDSSLFYIERILDISHEIKNDSLEHLALDRLAMQCYRIRNFSKSEFYLRKLTVHPITTERNRMDYYNTLALTFRARKMYDSAEAWFRKALPLAEALKDTAWIGLTHGNLGYNHYLAKDGQPVLPELLLDLKYSFSKRSYRSGLSALTTIVDVYLNENNTALAKVYYDSLAHNLWRAGDPEMKLDFLSVTTRYYEKTGDLKRALEFVRANAKFSDSIQNIRNIAKAADLEAQFDFNRQLRKIESLEQQSAVQMATNRQKNYLLAGTSVFILLGIGFIYVLQRSNRFKFRTNQILQEQNIMISQQAANLNELNATKDKLLSIISHDLRGPVNSLKALMKMAMQKIISQEEFGHHLGQLHKNVETVNFTLDNVLYWSRSQLRGIQTRPVDTGMAELFDETFNLFAEPVVAKGLTVENTIAPEIRVFADPDQIRLVLRNLISNAIKFTDNGGTIKVGSYPRKDMEVISVSDSGVGMSPERANTIFSSSSGETTTGTGGEKGTGLGLLLCREMVERNQGKIWLESKAGEGTTFFFSLIRTS